MSVTMPLDFRAQQVPGVQAPLLDKKESRLKFHDIYQKHLSSRKLDLDALSGSKKSEDATPQGSILEDAEMKFLKQMLSCLTACPTEIMLGISQWMVTAMGKSMGASNIKVNVGLRISFISLSGGCKDDMALVTPAMPKPCMRNLSDLLYLVNAHLDIPGGVSKKELAQMSECIAGVLQRPPPFPTWTRPVATAMIAVGYCPIFAGGWVETFLVGLISFALAMLGFWKRIADNYDNIYFITIGLVATLVPLWYNQHVYPLNVMSTALSVQMWWLPGLPISMGVKYLAFGMATEGIAILFNALCNTFMLAFGMGLGFTMAQAFDLDTTEMRMDTTTPVPPYLHILFLMVATAGAMILKQANWRMFPAMTIASIAGFYATSWSTPILGAFSPLSGGFFLELVGMCYNLHTAQPMFPIQTIGLLPIVPGSTALTSVFTGLEPGQAGAHGITSSVGFLGNMFMICFCIYIGTVTCGFLFGWGRHNSRVKAICRHATAKQIVRKSVMTGTRSSLITEPV